MQRTDKIYAGARLRHLREDRGVTQAELARQLDLSPSYLNQIERDQRPLTASVLLRVTESFGVDPQFFASETTDRLIVDLREALLDEAVASNASLAEITELATRMPEIARAFVSLRLRYRGAVGPALAADHAAALGAPMPHEEVRDFFYDRENYVPVLDEAAEALVTELGLTPGDTRVAIATRLHDVHGVRITKLRDDSAQRRYDPESRVVALNPALRPSQQAFQLATQFALLEYNELLTELADEASFSSPQTYALTRIGLANYWAAALLMPYSAFHSEAEAVRYDVERLADHFRVSFEMICHRLSTLQRPGLRGVPFSFVRVDRAGNISKRQSTTGFHFSRTGGSCPLWTVYEAFSSPERILTQVAAMPDGRRYLWIARTITSRRRGYGETGKTFAVGLGCEIRHAGRLVYSKGLDLSDASAATPIGVGCKACERPNCPQRAFPPLGRTLEVDEDLGTFEPYAVRTTP